jgi:hypothetical protein
MKALALALVSLTLALPAFAQGVDIRTTPPQTPRPELIVPGPDTPITTPPENGWYQTPPGVRVPYDPAFVEPLSEEYETPSGRGRYGIAGWTPVGPWGVGYNDHNGWFGLGFAFTWGAPPRQPARPGSTPGAKPVPR